VEVENHETRIQNDVLRVVRGNLRKAGVDEEVQTTSEFLTDLEQISISSAHSLIATS
jgi:hypothetical protein